MNQQPDPRGRVIPFHSPVALTSVHGSLALDLTPRMAPPRPHLRTARACDLVLAEQLNRERVDAFVRRSLQAAVEITTGDRPVSQVLRHCVPTVYEELGHRARQVGAAAGTSPAAGRGPNSVRPVVVGVRTALIRDDALEASAHVRYGRRSRAVTARFEVVRDRWQCTVLEWG